jgi:hypothetical protein
VQFRDFALDNPIRAIREVSHDLTGRRPVRLAGGRQASALDIQREYHTRAVEYLDTRTPDRYVSQVVDLWGRVLDAVETQDFAKVDTEVDWVIKRKLFQRYQDRYSMELSDPKIAQLDLAYHDIKRGRGVFDLLQRKGLAAQDGPPEWRNEPFLFFCDEDGRPVNGIAGDYVSSEELNYRFQPSIPIDNAPTRPADAPWPSRFPCRLDSSTLQVNGDPVLAQVSPGPAACDAFRENCQSALVVELDRPDKPSSLYFQIEVKVVGGSKPYAFKHCGYASFFGSMGHRSPGHPLHAGSLKIGIANGLRRCLEEAGSGALDFQIALRLKGNGPLPAPLKVKSMSLISL